jgi:NADPH:quinone reductase-like Zn-dependent oxidoreductase
MRSPARRPDATPSLDLVRAVQITRFGGPEVLDIVEIPEPEAGPGQQLCDVSPADVIYADTHRRVSAN